MTNVIQVASREDTLNYDDLPITIFQPVASTVQVVLSYDWAVRGIYVVTNTGTLDVQVTINGTPVTFATDGTTVGASSTPKTRNSASGHMAEAGDVIGFVISNLASTPTQLTAMVYGQRT